jgi:undecaprenyl diphosphate synthase
MTLPGDGLPRHVAIIMDGNRRWAVRKGLPVVAGHREVVEKRIEELIEHAAEFKIPYITFWAFSTENWGRAKREVKAIMKLFRWALEKRAQRMIDKGARVRYIGDLKAFPEDIQAGFERMMRESRDNERITVTFALNYGGRDEIIRGIRKLFQNHESRIMNHELSGEAFSECLDTVGMPDPDLVIRTSGEQRLSGFMAWQSVYAELYFPETLMPDFGAVELDRALKVYGKRKRRFGKG